LAAHQEGRQRGQPGLSSEELAAGDTIRRTNTAIMPDRGTRVYRYGGMIYFSQQWLASNRILVDVIYAGCD
jgi:hypothetical protein